VRRGPTPAPRADPRDREFHLLAIRGRSMTRTTLSLALGLALLQPAFAQQTPPPVEGQVPVSYVGSNARLSLGVSDDLDATGELLFVFGEDGDSAWLAEAWFGYGGAGGIKFDYHWLWGGRTRDDLLEDASNVRVAKAFVAIDQNPFDDRKATLGFGLEREHGFFDVYLSHGLTDERLADTDVLTTTRLLTGTEAGRPYQQLETTTLTTRTFFQAYDWGVGLRGGRHFEESLWRVRGGLDYEIGDFDSHQTTASIGLDKMFRASPHSLSLEVEALRKRGEFELDRSDTRAWLLWRYDFGRAGSFRATNPTRAVEVSREVAGEPGEPRVVRNEVEISGDAFFAFDSTDIGGDSQRDLEAVLARLTGAERVSRVRVVGHTCDIGSSAYNQSLSERRAAAVRDFLVAQGIDAAEIETSGRGESAPKYPNDGAANRARNRRVDLTFLTVEETTEAAPATTRTVTEWVQEPVAAPPAWVERALRNPSEHKRTVDVYRFQTTDEAVTLGAREFINQGPIARDDQAETPFNLPAVIAVLANDSDPDNDPLQVVARTQPANGVVDPGPNGTLVYVPNAGFIGTNTFTYTVADPSGAQATATVTVVVRPPTQPANQAPQAANDVASTPRDTPVEIAALANDSDADGDALNLTAVSAPLHGLATIVGDRIRYVPAPGYVGLDQFTYTVSDGTDTATASITVSVLDAGNQNLAPIARDDRVQYFFNQSVEFDPRSNDEDPDGDEILVIDVQPASFGRIEVLDGGRRLRYVPFQMSGATERVTYTISDGRGGTATALITIYDP
jgi:outer membrane protein OmpA-like peptidoglycan-associated protein